MARSTMANLIARTRVLISDVAGPSQVFTDDAIEDTLDVHRVEMRQVPLEWSPTFVAGGAVQFKDFYSDVQHWESDPVLQDAGWNIITPSLAEELAGHWQFATNQTRGIRATGKTYDLYGASADLLDAWAASVKLDFGFQNKQDIYNRNQKFAMLKDLAAEYRKLALVRHSRASQSDASSTSGTNAVTYPAQGDSW